MSSLTPIQGLHHITIICSNAQRTIDFYTQVLGLRLVKKTVNFDDPGSYHLYFGDEVGHPGSAVTFFEWPNAPKGHPGIGGTHHFALIVSDYQGLLKWKRRLNDMNISVDGPLDRHYFQSIYFNDPDGTILEIATLEPGWTIDEAPDALGIEFREPPAHMLINNRDEARIRAETWSEPVPTLTANMALSRGMHHITAISSNIQRTQAFFGDLLGLRRVKMTSNFDDPTSAHWYWGVGEGRPGTLITYFERKPFPSNHPSEARGGSVVDSLNSKPEREGRVRMGTGQTHHYAFAVKDEESQLVWRERLLKAGRQVTPVLDRVYFKSIYTNDPDGHIVELATVGPGFAIDEPVAQLGQTLKLPPWLEGYRAEIERVLHPVTVPLWHPAENNEFSTDKGNKS